MLNEKWVIVPQIIKTEHGVMVNPKIKEFKGKRNEDLRRAGITNYEHRKRVDRDGMVHWELWECVTEIPDDF